MVKVSVSMLAYNHEPYIEQAVRGVLMQRANFDFEIVIGEDCSTDRTLEILLHLRENYPDKIRLLTSDHNLGMHQNYLRTLNACNGEYIALLDGDDFWCAEDKLQKQVDYLDQRPDFSMVFHTVLKVYEDNSQHPKIIKPTQNKEIFDVNDLLRSMFISTCSVLYRNGSIDEFPGWSLSLSALDRLTFILVATHGRVGFIDEVMATYRVQPSGVWTSMDSTNRLMSNIDLFEKLNPYLNFQYAKTIKSVLEKYWRNFMDELYDQAITLGSTKAAQDYCEKTYTNLKKHESLPAQWKQELFERVYCYYMISDFESGNYPAAWSAWLGMMKNDPSLLTNRGLLLIGMESSFNGRWRPFIEKFTRSHASKHE